MNQRIVVFFLFIVLTATGAPRALAFSKAAPAAALHVSDVCTKTDLFSEGEHTPVSSEFTKNWQKRFPLLIMNLGAPDHPLFWAEDSRAALEPINPQGFTPRVATTDNVIVLICNARQGDGSGINATPVLVNGPDANAALGGGADHGVKPPDYGIDRVFLLAAPTANDVVTVVFSGPTVPQGQANDDYAALSYKNQLIQDKVAQAKDQAALDADEVAEAHAADPVSRAPLTAKVKSDKATLDADNAKEGLDLDAPKIPARVTDTLATVLIERHRYIHYSIGGGLVLAEGSPSTFSILSAPTTTLTTTTVNSSTVLAGTTTPAAPGSSTQTTNASGTGTANFAYGVRSSRPQIGAVAGLTWYPFGHDTFPVGKANGFAVTYSSASFKQSLGLFFGTSVSSLGNFTLAPAYEVRPGVQVFAGTTWYSKTYLPSSVIACTGYGTSSTYASAPTTTSTLTTNTFGPPATTTTTTTVVSVSATNGCANGSVATQLSGSNLPTETKYEPAFSFGILFNTNLFKAFPGIK